MAHTLDTSTRFTGSATGGISTTYTCGAGTTVLVFAIVAASVTNRAGGSPTYNNVAMTQAGTGVLHATSGETGVEVWYMLNPPTGQALTLKAPNTGGLTLIGMAASFKAGAGKSSAFDTTNTATGTSVDPASSTAITAGSLVFAAIGEGANTWAPTGRTGNQLFDTDDGSTGSGAQYVLSGSATQSMNWTFGTSDDWAIRVVSFKEINAYTLTSDPGAVSLTGTAATLKAARKIAAASGAVAITGTDAVLAVSLSALPGSVSITGTAATLRATRLVNASSGAVGISGTAASLLAARKISAQSGIVAVSGTSANLVYVQRTGYTLTANSGSVGVAGTSASLLCGRKVQASSGSVSVSGTAASLLKGSRLSASPGIFQIAGTTASISKGFSLSASTGSVSVSGSNAGLLKGSRVSAASGSVAITGASANLIYTQPGRYVITANSGSVSVSGANANLLATRKLTASSGSFLIGGTTASLYRRFTLAAVAGSVALSGSSAALLASRLLTASDGSLLITGDGAALRFSGLVTSGAVTVAEGCNWIDISDSSRTTVTSRLVTGIGIGDSGN